MVKVIVEMKVIVLKETIKDDYHKTKVVEPEENKIKFEGESFEQAQRKLKAYLEMLEI